ncbi:HEAT repeat domain-containing protein [Nonomuraea aridisoli]|uniref:PBS lyase n=1 Tax=Nonomuraea aridisoli TaxID=2070368 RepID=A0A2W2ETK3_9ACTN|nr:PBS lyase [Nonomuraea aridisoli]PZG16860.1 PBS lyase [Nonomuraea aridisoli]
MAEEIFAGLDDIRWARMRHAYGPAADVPGLLRGLADPDPAVRETALDGMYGTVHHQGDVYPCTVAAIPFLLRIAADPGVPGRAEVVRLLAGIGSAEDPTELEGAYRKANQAVGAAYPLWEKLLEDADPRVREAVTEVLPACTRRGRAALTLLTARLPHEPDESVRTAIVRTVGTLARAEGDPGQEPRDWLAGVAAAEPGVRLRLVALTELTSLPGVSDVMGADDALDLLAAVYRTGTPVTEPAAFETATPAGAVRRSCEQAAQCRRAPEAADLVRGLSRSYGDRVAERVRLLTGLLRSPEWECHADALPVADHLVSGWRGDYRELVGVVGERIRDGHPRTRPATVRMLEDLGEVALPAVDALAEALESTPRRAVPHTEADGTDLPWVIEWASGPPTVSPGVRVLARAGDPRALPMVAWALDHEPMPNHATSCAVSLGTRAAPLLPLLIARLRDLPAGDRFDDRRDDVAYALAAIGPAAAEALPVLLAGPHTHAVIRALGKIAATEGEVVDALRVAAGAADRRTAVTAASALWEIAGDAEPALAVAGRYLDDDDRHAWRDAAELLAGVGQATKPQLTRLRRLTRRKDPQRGRGPGAALSRGPGRDRRTLITRPEWPCAPGSAAPAS